MPTRREFLSTTALTTTAAMFNFMESFAQPPFAEKAPGFNVLIMATNWGFDGNYEAFASKAKANGYDGVEVWLPGDEKSRNEFMQAVQKHDLKYAFLFGGWEQDAAKHLAQFQEGFKAALAMKPIYFNCHSGRDHFDFITNRKFIDWSYQEAKGSGIPVYHETHRGRILYSAPIAKSFIDALPDLKLTLDISHWCTVHESLLSDQSENITAALNRTEHIHARIGHPEGPQVNDPRAPEWESAVKAHFAWWDKIVERKRAEGKPLTFLTEFGPVDYMPALPYTRQPVANQWEINVYMKDVLKKRYG